jgi:hypothetical protein
MASDQHRYAGYAGYTFYGWRRNGYTFSRVTSSSRVHRPESGGKP